MSFTVEKKNEKLIFRDFGGYQTRNYSTMWCINEANKIYNWKDFDEIKIDTNDYYTGTGCSYIKNNFINLVPDFVFHSWPQAGLNDYTIFTNEIDEAGRKKYEINKVGWIGNPDTNFRRREMIEIGEKHKDLFDFFEMHWKSSSTGIFLNSTKYIYTPDLVRKYSMLVDIEGSGPYSARLKTLFWSHRPILLVNRPGNEYFFEYLKEWEHYIPIKRDLSDLIEKTKWCMENYDTEAKQIAENAYNFSKMYLTRDACYGQWNKIITQK
jgi:hypothetical protein